MHPFILLPLSYSFHPPPARPRAVSSEGTTRVHRHVRTPRPDRLGRDGPRGSHRRLLQKHLRHLWPSPQVRFTMLNSLSFFFSFLLFAFHSPPPSGSWSAKTLASSCLRLIVRCTRNTWSSTSHVRASLTHRPPKSSTKSATSSPLTSQARNSQSPWGTIASSLVIVIVVVIAYTFDIVRVTEKEVAPGAPPHFVGYIQVVDQETEAWATIDSRGIILSVNDGFTTLCGFPRTELVGKNISVVIPPPHAALHDEYIQRYEEFD